MTSVAEVWFRPVLCTISANQEPNQGPVLHLGLTGLNLLERFRVVQFVFGTGSDQQTGV